MDVRYIHEESVHNLDAPKQIVPILINLFHPSSVIDVGCGIGTFLHEFKKNGIKTHGIDGPWVNKALLTKHISLEDFEEVDLEKFYQSNVHYDLALCLEVVEHLKPESAQTIIKTLTNLSDIIVFSAAIPHQGGMNHVNEQWPDYWEKLFNDYGFKMHDVIRPIIWNNPNIFFWYKQNMFIAVKKEFPTQILDKIRNEYSYNTPLRIVHPETFEKIYSLAESYKNKLGLAYEGRLSFKEYFEMIKIHLWRVIFNKK